MPNVMPQSRKFRIWVHAVRLATQRSHSLQRLPLQVIIGLKTNERMVGR
jgi:hypothetical protein